jgi:hypothetical protein
MIPRYNITKIKERLEGSAPSWRNYIPPVLDFAEPQEQITKAEFLDKLDDLKTAISDSLDENGMVLNFESALLLDRFFMGEDVGDIYFTIKDIDDVEWEPIIENITIEQLKSYNKNDGEHEFGFMAMDNTFTNILVYQEDEEDEVTYQVEYTIPLSVSHYTQDDDEITVYLLPSGDFHDKWFFTEKDYGNFLLVNDRRSQFTKLMKERFKMIKSDVENDVVDYKALASQMGFIDE